MSIYPKGTKPETLMFKFDVAALNLPVPDDLTDRKDAQEWSGYVRNLSPAQQIKNFAEALDQFHALAPAGRDLRTAPEADQVKAYSKWMAASALMVGLHDKFHFDTAETYQQPSKFYKSDIERTIFNVVDFLKAVNSADVQAWEERQARHRAVDRESLLDIIHKYEGKPRNPQPGASQSPKRS